MIRSIFKILIAMLLILSINASATTVTASNTVQYSSLTQASSTVTSYTLSKQITMTDSYQGSMRMCFDLKGDDYDYETNGYGMIYRNGVSYGNQQSVLGFAFVTKCQDFTGLNINAGEDFQLFYHGESGYEVSVSNFKIMFDIGSSPTPTPTPTPTPPATPPALGLVSDTITVQHTTSLCRPYPVETYNPSVVPSTYGCNDAKIFYLDQYPLNSLPSGGLSYRISDSEMVLLFAELNDYPSAGFINLTFWNKDTNTLMYSYNNDIPACAGNCNWAYWSWRTYAFIGHFGWEINSPGYYNATVLTTWGAATYNFKVELHSPNTTIPPVNPPQNLLFEVVGQGQMYALKNGNFEALATPGHTVNVSYIIGDSIGFTAYPYLNNHLINVCDVPFTSCETQSSYNFNVIGDLPDKMVATFQANNTSSLMSLTFEAIGQGQIYAFKNGSLEGLATPGHNAIVKYYLGDTISFTAYPYLNNTLISMCDYPFTSCETQLSYTYQVIGTLPQKMIGTFTNHVNAAPTINPTPQPTSSPGSNNFTPDANVNTIGNAITYGLSSVWFLGALVAGWVPLGYRLILGVIVIIYAVIKGNKNHQNNGFLYGVVSFIAMSAVGIFPLWVLLATIAIGVIALLLRGRNGQ